MEDPTTPNRSGIAGAEPLQGALKTSTTRGALSILALVLIVVGACTPEGDAPLVPAENGASTQSAAESSALLAPIEGLMAAFNAHDPQTMTQFVHDDLVWSSVTADDLMIEAQGRDALKKGMTDYFASLPSVRSEIEDVHESGSFVTVGERVHWQMPDPTGGGTGEARTQRALAVYHVTEGLIQSVWYFPAEP